ncbi:hypothetical protein [Kitasatospora sp. NPDC059160]|uniref:hypothetical protein n=1 Tax=Kitasatospora sp. NPDC059160 TaxID=3346748 RepID=UPI0036A8C63A
MTPWNPGDLLAPIVCAVLDERAIAYTWPGRAGTDFLALPMTGASEVLVSDINSDLSGTVGACGGLQAIYYPTGLVSGRSDFVTVYEPLGCWTVRGTSPREVEQLRTAFDGDIRAAAAAFLARTYS